MRAAAVRAVRSRPECEYGVVVQLVRIPACHAGGRGFESRPLRQTSNEQGRTRRFALLFVNRVEHRGGSVVNAIACEHSRRTLRGRRDARRVRLPRASMFDLVAQAQAHRADHPGPADRAAVRVLRRRLLLPRRRRDDGGGDGRRRERSRRTSSTKRCASSRTGCASSWARNFDPAMFDNPEVRFALLEQLDQPAPAGSKARDEKFRVTRRAAAAVHRRDPGVPGGRQVLARPLPACCSRRRT